MNIFLRTVTATTGSEQLLQYYRTVQTTPHRTVGIDNKRPSKINISIRRRVVFAYFEYYKYYYYNIRNIIILKI